jgi:hypothetical protein
MKHDVANPHLLAVENAPCSERMRLSAAELNHMVSVIWGGNGS